MSWYKVTLTGEQLSANEMTTLQNRFQSVLQNCGNPQGMVAVCDKMPEKIEGQYKLQTSVYFSPKCFPQASQLISDYSGIPCEPPDFDNTAFLAGDHDAVFSQK